MERLLTQNTFQGDALAVIGLFVAVVVVAFITVKLISNYKWSIFRVDRMKGDEFEDFIKEIYELLGYKVEKTKKSGDQGIDLIIKKHFKRTGIQLKRYKGAVGNSAVQEAVAGKRFYKLDRVCVLSNTVYTKSAKELARANRVELYGREDLKKLIKKARRRANGKNRHG